MTEQTRLDVLERQSIAQERVIQQIDLAYRQVVRRAPVAIEKLQFGLITGCRPLGLGEVAVRIDAPWRD
jgi:hypothetical protein